MTLIDGKATAATIKAEIAARVEEIIAAGGKRPHLAAILVGHDGGSETYVANKVKACEVCGFKSSLIRFEDDVTEAELLAKVQELNEDDDVDGFIVQLPLPRHISEQKVIEAIDYRKDVDGFHPINVGRMAIGLPCFISATPKGILELLQRYGVETRGNVVFFKHFLQLLAQGRACRSAREGGKTVGNEAKGEFVGLASHRLRHEGLHKTTICAADGKVGVLRRERAEPVGHDVEERHALHQLLECREEHVCSLLGKLLYLLYLAPPRSIGLNVPNRRVLTFRV